MKIKIILITILALSLGIWGYSIYSNRALESAISMPNSAQKLSVTFEIKPGESMSAVASNLKKEGLIPNTDPFVKYAKKGKLDKTIKAGVYTLNTAMSPKEILEVFVTGSRSEIWVTIPEGWRIDQIATYLGKQGLPFTAKEFEDYAYVKNFSSTPFLAGLSGKTSLEGYLFPDTYKVYSDAQPADVIQSMLDNFGKKVTKDMMDKANSMGFTLRDFIILTSIIEKESAHNEDIRKIASVYHNRLNDGMLFQSDATITYITRRPDASPTFDETKIDNPYNTYLYKGLPPGPVGNPGIEAMEATLNPETTPYLFFLTDSENRAHFAITYEEHLENQRKYMN